MKTYTATSPVHNNAGVSEPTQTWERLSTACVFARANEENSRGRFAEILATVLFAGCIAFSALHGGATSYALHRSGALDQFVARAMAPKKAQPPVVLSDDAASLATSAPKQPARANARSL